MKGKVMNRKILMILAVAAFAAGFSLRAQSSFSGEEITSLLNNGYEMYGKAKYATAIGLFDTWLATEKSGNKLQRSEAEYHAALASMRLMSPDAEYRMQRFISSNGESPRLNEARLESGLYCYQQRNYTCAIEWFEQTDRLQLTDKELPGYLFKLGYSHYRKGDEKRAQMLFSELIDVDTDYTSPALYYYSAIAYENEFYSTALEGFERLRGDETFGSIVPFYIVQIYYLDKNYDGILATAPSLIDQAGKTRETELYRFIGDAHFQKGQYNEAIPYLEKFIKETRLSDRNDKYELAYSYYQTDAMDKATKLFNEVVGRSDMLTQNAYYMLGSCYLKAGDKKRAQMAFSAASGMSYDPDVQEEALFNFAKLAYENSYAPFGEGIEALHNYIQSYPGSGHVSEAYDYLISAYMRMRNYQAALNSLEKISSKDDRLKRAYQKVTYYRGIEQFRNKMYADAVQMFGKSLVYKEMNPELRAQALYWRAEANYRLGNAEAAVSDWESFRLLPGAKSIPGYDLIDYNLGYVWYNEGQYPKALPLFMAFNGSVDQNTNADIATDARNRIADCYYIKGDYTTAISYYNKVIDFARLDADYAMFQKGFAQGLSNNNEAKIATLTGLINKYSKSAYVPNALFERGRAYVAINQPSKGEADFTNIIAWYTNSQYVPPAMVQLALIYYNAGDNGKAVEQFKKVIENYRDTPEARNAVNGLRNAYTDMDDVESYFAYMKTVQGVGDIDVSTRDSMTYISGENQYVRGNCERSSEIFSNYLRDYPGGSFATNARFYLADCLNRTGKTDEALELFFKVISVGNNQFMEQSLLGAASITFGKADYLKAWSLYEQLSREASNPENRMYAYLGMMRSASALEDDEKVLSSAEMVLESGKLTEDLAREATFLMAKANQRLGNNEEALDDYRRVSQEVSTAYGAEAKYHVAELLWMAGDTGGAEKEANEFVDMSSPHAYWTGKTFILLSDIAVSKGDTFQAKATLQSLIDYYTVPSDGIIDEARDRLAALTPDEPADGAGNAGNVTRN
ncbi:MAG: tetratricopeptide repeat protein [Bacteroidales bacterium]|jgi:TolA-binding protein|nr:tetratricopeptide repeat protein [Bacteroidales bacterium]